MSIGFAMRDGTVLPAHEVALGIYLLMLNEPKLIFDEYGSSLSQIFRPIGGRNLRPIFSTGCNYIQRQRRFAY
jgi:hypothetical protein